jgi:hypothetical protein
LKKYDLEALLIILGMAPIHPIQVFPKRSAIQTQGCMTAKVSLKANIKSNVAKDLTQNHG